MGLEVNHITLSGRIVSEVEWKHVANGSSVAKVTIAFTKSKKNVDGKWETTDGYISVRVWGGKAAFLHQHCKMLDTIIVSGELEHQQWETGGVKHERMVINATELQRLVIWKPHPKGAPPIRLHDNAPKPPPGWGDKAPRKPLPANPSEECPFDV